jgi:hypothetical protein
LQDDLLAKRSLFLVEGRAARDLLVDPHGRRGSTVPRRRALGRGCGIEPSSVSLRPSTELTVHQNM